MSEVIERCDFSNGDFIDGKYVIKKTLGEGSFGKVFKVSDSKDNVRALKVLKLWTVTAEEREGLSKRFKMEFETGQINSDYLVHTYSYGSVNSNPYFVMDFCSGGDLSQYVGKSRSINIDKTCFEILSGLGDLHRNGKVHRDMKPENVLFKGDKAVLTDFGISGDRNNRLTNRNIFGKPEQLFGTYPYMPPEQLLREKGDATVLPTTDIFSFGVMLYYILTGNFPFGSLVTQNDLAIYVSNNKNNIWDRNLLSKVNEGNLYRKIIEGCLTPNYHNRIQTTSELISMLPQKHDEQPKEQNYLLGNNYLLHVMQGEEYGKVYKLNDLLSGKNKVLTIGRFDYDIYNSIAIKEELSCNISRRHCTIEYENSVDAWIIRDGQWRSNCPISLRSPDSNPCKGCRAKCNPQTKNSYNSYWTNSLNGTFVNSQKVTTDGYLLHPGDIISIGNTKLRVEKY